MKNWLIIFLTVIQRIIIFLSAIQRIIIFLSAIQRVIVFPKCESARYWIFFAKNIIQLLLQFLDMKRIISWYVLIISVI